jgi:DNA-directed RNA polymerase subunit RPC12/RpoP
MTKEQRLVLLKQIEEQIYVSSLESTLQDDLKSVAIHSIIEEETERLEQEPCDECVSREAVEDAIAEYGDGVYGERLGYSVACEILSKVPSVTPQPKTGHWIGIDEEPHEDYECNRCGYAVSTYTANIEPHTEYKYCPNCGAKMVEKQESEE